MALYALVRNGEFIEVRDVDPQSVPQHKFDTDGGLMLRPYIEDETPSFQPLLENVTMQIVVTPEAVTKTLTVVRIDLDDQKKAVKNEARRRILQVFPDWLQTNMLARSLELQDIHREIGSWTESEHTEYELYKTRWAWIKAIRVFSNQIEAMDPIPSDFTHDSYWTS